VDSSLQQKERSNQEQILQKEIRSKVLGLAQPFSYKADPVKPKLDLMKSGV
jgi:hypothetical protein